MTRVLVPFLLLGQTGAAPADLLPRLYADGVFRGATPRPAAELPRGAQGVQLIPGGYGGEWFLTLGGPKAAVGAQLTYVGSVAGLSQNTAPVAKLSGRMGATVASACFAVGTDQLSALRAFIEDRVRAGSSADVNSERRFGTVRVQVLSKHAAATDTQPAGHAEVDVILTRLGAPGSGAAPACRI
ncbi:MULTISPECIES: hypothetical protein [Deinococcus]|uniref:Uncharacterized protein n=1 Tax=Deinococcus rufus TaxID=2136097 RepID=A0ABV7Z8G6_9DEIO|nr:hypothetical protein [Deinococcus sp. AB2017081]WQE95701.1 hypothetical protein U2P90_02120 [Deinococcus sp. AB2017081]